MGKIERAKALFAKYAAKDKTLAPMLKIKGTAQALAEVHVGLIKRNEMALLLRDPDGHFAVLYESPMGRIALQFQEGYCPVVHPEPVYQVMKLMKENDAINKLYEET